MNFFTELQELKCSAPSSGQNFYLSNSLFGVQIPADVKMPKCYIIMEHMVNIMPAKHHCSGLIMSILAANISIQLTK